MTGYYGEAPVDLGPLDLDWHEFMHYLYLPVRIPARDDTRRPVACDARVPATGAQYALPERLGFLGPHVHAVIRDAAVADHLVDPYVYVTARRGFATPGNPLNRPGWHCDDFGGTDLNYIWSDRWPTRFLVASDAVGRAGGLTIGTDDVHSMNQMGQEAHNAWVEMQMQRPREKRRAVISPGPVGHLLRLTPYVIHDTPLIPKPGGMRSFFKISVSTHRYNLLGNSRNHLLDYDWPMHDRAAVRNQPGGNGDYVVEEAR